MGKTTTTQARQPKAISTRQSAEQKLAELRARLAEVDDLASAGATLAWDQLTYMPRRGAAVRARQRATLSRLAHERSIAPELGRLLDQLGGFEATRPYDSDEASLIRVARRDFERAIKIPSDYVARASEFGAQAYEAWKRARPANDFVSMRPYLERAIELGREYAGFFAPYQHVADPLIDEADEGMTAASVRRLFAALRQELIPIVERITAKPKQGKRILSGFFDEAAQLAFGVSVVRRIGYDFDRGRLDKTTHPFCTRLSAGDVRITTRVFENDLMQALFSTLHEAGHALYEQGVDPALEGTPLARGASVGVHESQSRLWENIVGRSSDFWQFFYPRLRKAFSGALDGWSVETFYRAINRVERSLIRTDADEVTYNLHILLRFDLELKMLEGSLDPKHLPEAWRAGMASYVGIVPEDDRDGCLQDVHWFSGVMGGAFQSYTIGNILSAQFYAAALKDHPHIPDEIASGSFETLHHWLRENLYRHGRKFKPNELVRRVTGEPMNTGPYLTYLRAKHADELA